LLEAFVVLLGQLLFHLLCPFFGRRLRPAVAAVATVPIAVAVPYSVSLPRPISRSTSVAVITAFKIPIAIAVSISVTLSVAVAAPVPLPPAFSLPLSLLIPLSLLFPLFLATLAPLLFSALILLPFLLPAFFPCGSLGFASLGFLPSLDLALEPPLLLLDRAEFGPDALPFSPAGRRLGGIFLIRLCAAHPFCFGCLVANLGAA
jgi:hypothetical protein